MNHRRADRDSEERRVPPAGSLDFEKVYTTYADRLYRYCYRLCNRNAAEAEDLAQETFVQAYSHLRQLKDPASVRSWLYTIARRIRLRNVKRRPEAEPLEEAPEAKMAAPDPIMPKLERLWLDWALQRLPEAQREAVLLVKIEGLTHQEAAEIAEVPLGTMLTRVREGRINLRKFLAEAPEAPYGAALLPGFVLDHHLRRWANAKAPASLQVRVYRELGLPLPTPSPGAPGGPALARSAAEAGTVGIRGLIGPQRPAARTGRKAVAAAGGVGILAAVGYWATHRTSIPKSAVPLQRTLEAMRRVRDFHAKGTRESQLLAADGSTQKQGGTLDVWFKAPDRFRQTLHYAYGTPNTALDEMAVGGKGEIHVLPSSVTTPVLPMNEADIRGAFPAMSFVQPDGRLAAAVHNRNAVITVLNGELGNRTVSVISVEETTVWGTARWSLYVEPSTQRVLRCEYMSQEGALSRSRNRTAITLDEFEYERGVDEGQFRFSHPTP